MTVTINPERPDTHDARALIAELDAELEPLYPIDARYGFTVDKLIAQQVEFFIVREAGQPAGCGGVKFFGVEFAELKRMYVRPAFRGRGLANRLLVHLEAMARERGVPLLRLETGVYQRDAIAMYEKFGFYRIPPFDVYTDDPISLCYEKKVETRE